MTRYFEISFSDLDSEKKEELIEEVAKQLKEEWHTEVDGIREEYGQNRTWQDIYCEIQGIDDDLRDTDYNDWEFSIDNQAAEEAQDKLYDAFKNLEVGVEI